MDNVIKFAKAQGYAGARELKPWRGYRCYEALVSTDEDAEPAVGFPQLIMRKGGVIRFAQYDEAIAYLDEVVMDE